MGASPEVVPAAAIDAQADLMEDRILEPDSEDDTTNESDPPVGHDGSAHDHT